MNKKEKLERILNKYGDMITGESDLTAGKPPSRLFYLLADKLSYLVTGDMDTIVTPHGVKRRRRFHPVLGKLGKYFLPVPQVFENRNFLRDPTASNPALDSGIMLPPEPVIWTANHGFKDDTLATVLAAQRHAYILFGSLPQFYNTLDGITAFINGVVMTNRKMRASRKTSVEKAVHAAQCGADLIIFPEGVWNKSPNALTIDLWPGIYRIACETGAKIIPIVHYLEQDRQETPVCIHTVVDDPIQIDNLTQSAALEYLRDILATWYYYMMEAYGKSDRADILGNAPDMVSVWEQHLRVLSGVVDRYDKEIELSADYRPKQKTSPLDVWGQIAEIPITVENAKHIVYAKQLTQRLTREDFQHRF